MLGSTFKGIVAGLIIGYVATRTRSLPIGIATGLVVGLALAYLVTLSEPYFWEIMLPGGIVGVIVGYATFVYGGTSGGAFDSVRPSDRVSRASCGRPASRSSPGTP